MIEVPILDNYAGGYQLQYDGKYITLLGKDKNYTGWFSLNNGSDYEQMVLVPVVKEVRNAEPEIVEVTDTVIKIKL